METVDDKQQRKPEMGIDAVYSIIDDCLYLGSAPNAG